MQNIPIQELKQTLAEILRRVELGETFTITRHGKPVARLQPAVEQHVHVGSKYHLGGKLEPLGGFTLGGGSILDVLFDDRRGGDR